MKIKKTFQGVIPENKILNNILVSKRKAPAYCGA